MAKEPKDQLLREAIADAKQIREAAIANARLVIEEAFKPQISSMLSKKLRTELDEPTSGDGYGSAEGGETDDKAVMEGENPPSSGIGTSPNKEPADAAFDSSKVGSGTEAGKEVEDWAKEKPIAEGEEPPAADGHGSAEGGETIKGAIEESEVDEDAQIDDDLDLEAVIRELESDVGDEEMGGEEPHVEGCQCERCLGMADEDVGSFDNPAHMSTDPGEEDFAPPEGEGDEVLDLEGEGEGISDDDELDLDVDDDEGLDDLDGDAEGEKFAPDGDNDEDDLDLEEILREMESESGTSHAADVRLAGVDPNYYNKVEGMRSEIAGLKRNLREHREVVGFLREKLQEVNMLNAKLLYTNRLFKSNNLDLSQKQRVIETFDRASTLREVKLVFATMAESFKGSSKKGGRTITEGFASRSTGGSTAPKNPQVLVEAADSELVARLQKLAGIKKNS